MSTIIELRGVEFHNKGAELMLHAIIEKVRSEIPDAIFVMEKTDTAPRHKQKELGIYTKTNFKIKGIPARLIFPFVPKFLRRKSFYINDGEINVVMDGSGFAFGDQWGAKKAGYRLANHVARWRRANKKIIMMPQALGPFTDPDLKDKMKIAIKYCNLIFARDRMSYQYITELEPGAKNIFLRPDFTNLIKGSVPPDFDPNTCEVAIIPNNKMIEKTESETGGEYPTLLKTMVEIIQSKGFKPFFLIHEGKKDLNLALKTNERLGNAIPVLVEDNPLYVKGIIGKSKAVITSRFHGLVSALAQGTPCLATGWSHKYEMLLEDYNYPEGLVDVKIDNESLSAKLESILNNSSASAISENLKTQSITQKKLSENTWKDIFALIRTNK